MPKVEAHVCPDCGAKQNATAVARSRDGGWRRYAVSFVMDDGNPIHTGWSVECEAPIGGKEFLECNVCRASTPFEGFWGMEYDTNGNQKFRNVFVDGYLDPLSD